jgi:hypothetical protein|tara:strand:+ start:424 stop:603 length:180 start_codon:yes stop_codon:yes gene_type:complete
MMQMLLSFSEIGIQPEEKKVPDGKQDHQNIFELENKFDNSGHKQGVKYNSEQRMKTVGY